MTRVIRRPQPSGKVDDPMVTYGADPDEEKTTDNADLEWLISNSSAGYVEKGGESPSAWRPRPRHTVEHLIFRFMTHERQTMHSIMSETHRAILGNQFSRLLSSGYERDDLQLMIDRYWQTPSSQRSGNPILPFCNRAFQQKLLDHTYAKTSSSVLEWIYGSFAPVEGLPWDASQDADYKSLVMMEGIDALYSYPEVVADILSIQEDPSPALREFTEQLHWNWKLLDNQATCLLELVPTTPAEVMKRGKARTKQATLSDAIALAQGA